MFMLIGFSEKAGSGVNKIIKGWREANWQKPYVEEFSRPDKVELTLPMISLLPDDAVIKLKELFDGKVENLTQDELTALVTCYSEGGINNTQLQYVIPQHRSDITKMLKKLCNQGFLISEGNRKGTKYHVNDPERKVGSPELAKNHGVFVSSRKEPEKLDFMLQKPRPAPISAPPTTTTSPAPGT